MHRRINLYQLRTALYEAFSGIQVVVKQRIRQGFLFSLLFFSAGFSSCSYYPVGDFHNTLQSGGYVQYVAEGNMFFIPDSILAGDPSEFLLGGDYSRDDSVLNLMGHSYSYSYFTGIQIHLLQCVDTGVFALESGEYSTANVTFGGMWSTDSLRKGQVHLTLLDTTKKLVSGTFRFWAKAENDSQPDSVLVDSGKFVNFPIAILHLH
jgi:hypothetical protein